MSERRRSFGSIILLLITLVVLTVLNTRHPITLRDDESFLPSPSAVARFGRGVIRDSDLSKDGKTLVIGTSIGVYVHQASTLSPQWFYPTSYPVSAVGVSPDGLQIIAGLTDGTLVSLSVPTGQPLHITSGKGTGIVSIDWVSDERIALITDDGVLLLIDSDDHQVITESWGWVPTENNHGTLAVSPDGNWIAGGWVDGVIILWDAQTGERVYTLRAHRGYVEQIIWQGDGAAFLSASSDGTVIRWDAKSGETVQVFYGLDFRSLGLSDDARWLLTGSKDGLIRLWDMTGGEAVNTFHSAGTIVDTFWLSNRPRAISLSNSGEVMIWNTKTGERVRSFEGYTSAVVNLWFIDHDTIELLNTADQVITWNFRTNIPENIIQYREVARPFLPVEDTFENLRASGMPDNSIVLWNVLTNDWIHVLPDHADWIRDVAFSPDGCLLASGSADRTGQLWSVETGESLQVLLGHTDWVEAVVWSPDGETIATGSADGTAIIWKNTQACN